MKSLRFEQEVDGVPVEIAVKQADGTDKVISLFLATDENNLMEMSNKMNKQKEKQKELKVKYPTLDNDLDSDDTEQMEEMLAAYSEMLAESYDGLFGIGTYKQLSDSGLGILKLQPLLDDITDGIVEEIEEIQKKEKTKSAKRKAEILIKNKKKKK